MMKRRGRVGGDRIGYMKEGEGQETGREYLDVVSGAAPDLQLQNAGQKATIELNGNHPNTKNWHVS